MPSPFRRRSGAIKPMSQAELDASLAELEAEAAQDDKPAMGHMFRVEKQDSGKYRLAYDYDVHGKRQDGPIYVTNLENVPYEFDTSEDAARFVWPEGLDAGPGQKQRRY